MVNVPAGNFLAVSVALPDTNVALPKEVVPFLKVTVPVAPPGNDVATVAVNTTASPTVDGFGLDVSVVVVA